MTVPTHKLYIDDSGNKDYSPNGQYPITGGRTRYFVFGGLLCTTSEAGAIEKKMHRIKQQVFGIRNVEIKAHWLRRADQRSKRYLEPYDLSEDDLIQFSDAAYRIILTSECKLIACIVDKAEVQQRYKENAHYAASIAYDCLLQRAQQEMLDCNGHVHVTMDDMSGATAAGNQHATLLRKQHTLFQKYGSNLIKGMMLDRIGGLAFRDSSLDERLQLADLVAYAVFRQFVDHGPAWEDDTSPQLETYEYFDRLHSKFRNRDGRVQGYGVVKFPLNKRVKWSIS